MYRLTLSNFILLVLYLVGYFLLLLGCYVFVSPIYGYSGFRWTPDIYKIFEGVSLLVLFVVLLPSNIKKPSDILLHIQFIFPVLPMLVLYGVQNQPSAFLYATMLSFMVMMLIVRFVRLKSIRIRTLTPLLYHHTLLGIGWGVVGTIICLGGWRYFNLNIWRVYEFRTLAANNLPSIFGYILPLTSKIIFPLSFLLAVVRKDIVLALVALAGSVMMFGLTAHKGPLFYPFAVLAMYSVLQFRHKIHMLLLSYLMIIVLSLVLYFLYDDIRFGSLFLRRVLLVPANINYLYYDFFSSNPFVWWAPGKITFNMIEYNYPLDVPHLIGSVYYNNAEAGANTGWIGSGYANAGYFGMLMYASMIGFLLLSIDCFGKFFGNRIIVPIMVPPLLAVFMSSDLFTALLTHGTILAILLLLFLPRAIDRQLVFVRV